jgi:phosphoglycolate phosphatase
MYKELIIFDLDGTLIDSVPDLALAINDMLVKLDRDTFSEESIRDWVGNGAKVLVSRALSGEREYEGIDENLLDKAMEIFLKSYTHFLSHSTKPYDGVIQTLKELKSRGYKMVIVTNKPYEFVPPLLKTLKMDSFFDFYLGGDSLGEKKPSPMPLNYVCQKCNIDKSKAIMVGDSSNDLISANSANIDSIGVTYGYSCGEDISIYKPTFIINELKEMLNILD